MGIDHRPSRGAPGVSRAYASHAGGRTCRQTNRCRFPRRILLGLDEHCARLERNDLGGALRARAMAGVAAEEMSQTCWRRERESLQSFAETPMNTRVFSVTLATSTI